MNTALSSRHVRALALATGLVLVAAAPAHGRQQGSDNRVGIIAGQWFGADFKEATIIAEDAFGPAEFGSALRQGNSPFIGLQYTGFFSSWFGAEVSLAYMSNTWTTVSGRVANGEIVGAAEEITGVTTVPMNLNAVVRPTILGGGPHPYVTGGVGGVLFDFDRANAPLVIPPGVGPPVDTLLFDLELGWRLSPNAGVGVMYAFADRVEVRAEGRMWFTVIEDTLNDEIFVQPNRWLALTASWVF